MSATADLRLGVDIGGTFTDLVLHDPAADRIVLEKVLTTPDAPERAVLEGVGKILAKAGFGPESLKSVIHGTTLVANALIERKGVETALITTKGFRDILEFGREWRYDLFDLTIDPPTPLVPRARRLEVPERVGPDGAVVTPLDEDAVRRLARQLAGSSTRAVAVVLLHAFRNSDHEVRIGEILAEEAPELAVSLSSEVTPEIGEYERSSTTVANAYVHPVFRDYVARLESGLKQAGFTRDLFLMLSDGGAVHAKAAVTYPIRLVQSGPAGGAQAAALFGQAAGLGDVMCFDMGGTTAKACLIEDGRPTRARDFEVARMHRFSKGSGLPLQVPVVDMIEVGAGGGSIARIDGMGLIQVGPDSASAQPGPACYGQGGEDATVTDADLVLGYLDPGNFLGGDMALDVNAARAALQNRIGTPLGLNAEQAAWGVHETVTENMAQAAAIHALEKGRRIDRYSIVAIGGAGPVHACSLARKMGAKRVVAPAAAGVASALGMIASPPSFEFVQADMRRLDEADWPAVATALDDMESRGRDMLRLSGVADADAVTTVSALMRYVGQGYEVETPTPRDVAVSASADNLRQRFDTAYKALFGRAENMAVEIISWRVVVAGPVPELTLKGSGTTPGQALKGHRKAWFSSDGFVDTPVYDAAKLATGDSFDGPALVEARESTLVIPPAAKATIDPSGAIVVDLL